ncbi:uncharacterized protein BO80DRAFT_31894 [Aspergillus ibericus CBS 121593]|uniref:Uncharacterized protein n=1 Tax=Aspergillus ibericus CBS 121593 TaxID=1448316 RepID=A0A395H329_9EURO|nr:hypothetical protein BO80DRAFT_31894 [Aspergillus ibericus CBS 121593]RAL02297.1 hypothetical protein BO80DRAFT_31894 [Aspergillus ibericus CBS 121593]
MEVLSGLEAIKSLLVTMAPINENRALADSGVNQNALNVPPDLESIMPPGIEDKLKSSLNEARERHRQRFNEQYHTGRFIGLCSADGEIYAQHTASVQAILRCTPPMKIPKNTVYLSPFGDGYRVFEYQEQMALNIKDLEARSACHSAVQQMKKYIEDLKLSEAARRECLFRLRTSFLGEMKKWSDDRSLLYVPTREETIRDFCRLIRERVEDGDQVAENFEREARGI